MSDRNSWRGMILGTLGGAVGTWVMGYYFQAVSKLAPETMESPDDAERSHALDDISLVGKHYREGETSTVTVGRIVYSTLAGKEPETQEMRNALSQEVHWAFGTSMGALYGMLRSGARPPDLLGGALFGTGVWLFASEALLPLLGLAPGPTTESSGQHFNHFAAHVVYGVTVAAFTRMLEEAMG